MNELDEKNRQALVAYRLQRAYSTIKEAEVMLNNDFYNAAVNRLYYACFYAAEALLLANKITARTHAWVRTMLGLHFVSKGLLSLESAITFGTLFEKRHSSDYDDFVFCDKALIEDLLPKAEAFIDEINDILKNR